MTSLDRRMLARNAVLDPRGRAKADLRVDRDHPFFFDHPLDHVPGLLLIEGAAQLVQNEAASTEYIGGISARFIRYAYFDLPVTLTARSLGDRSFGVSIVQDNVERARIELDLATFGEAAPAVPIGKVPAPCPANFLNKRRPENILISEPRVAASGVQAEILPAPPSCLLADSALLQHPLFLLESFMQTQRYLNRLNGQAERMRDILTGISIGQLSPVADKLGMLRIRGAKEFAETDHRRFARSASIFAGAAQVAECAMETARIVRAENNHAAA